MIRLPHAAALAACLFAASPALADDCDHWSASAEETEGGSTTVARTCMPTGNAAFELWLECGPHGFSSMRMIPVAPKDYPPGGFSYQSRFVLKVDDKSFDLPMVYEDMDGAMAGRLEWSSDIYKALRSGKTMSLTDSQNKVPASTYSLKNSSKAFDAMEKACPAG